MTGIRWEKIDEGKIWSACPNCAAKDARIRELEDELNIALAYGVSEHNSCREAESRVDDVEGMAKELYRHHTGCRWETVNNDERNEYIGLARAVSAWLKEG